MVILGASLNSLSRVVVVVVVVAMLIVTSEILRCCMIRDNRIESGEEDDVFSR